MMENEVGANGGVKVSESSAATTFATRYHRINVMPIARSLTALDASFRDIEVAWGGSKMNSGGAQGPGDDKPRRTFHQSTRTYSRRTAVPLAQVTPLTPRRKIFCVRQPPHAPLNHMMAGFNDLIMGRHRANAGVCPSCIPPPFSHPSGPNNIETTSLIGWLPRYGTS